MPPIPNPPPYPLFYGLLILYKHYSSIQHSYPPDFRLPLVPDRAPPQLPSPAALPRASLALATAPPPYPLSHILLILYKNHFVLPRNRPSIPADTLQSLLAILLILLKNKNHLLHRHQPTPAKPHPEPFSRPSEFHPHTLLILYKNDSALPKTRPRRNLRLRIGRQTHGRNRLIPANHPAHRPPGGGQSAVDCASRSAENRRRCRRDNRRAWPPRRAKIPVLCCRATPVVSGSKAPPPF